MWTANMKWRPLLAIALLSTLTACGGGGGGGSDPDPVVEDPVVEDPVVEDPVVEDPVVEDPDEDPVENPPTLSKGSLIPGPVKGLHYATASQSGLTNDAGEFQYQDGEMVTFSIGGIELGSAPGAAEVNLAELFDTELPTTEAGVRAELNWDKPEVTGFDRVANAMMLLMALDADGDIRNGLDLGGRHEQLANASIDFGNHLLDFRHESLLRLRNAAKIPGDISEYASLHYLYEALGIQVAVQAQTEFKRVEWDTGTSSPPSGSIEYSYTTSYNSLGLPVSESRDSDGDGNPDYRNASTWDEYGRQLFYGYSFDNDDDGTTDESSSSSSTWYNNGNQQTYSKELDSDGDGVPDESLKTTYTHAYDEAGNLQTRKEKDTDMDGVPDEISTAISTFDELGNELTRIEEEDTNADGVPDSRISYTYVRDAAGSLLSRRQEEDKDADGTPDTIKTVTNTYDNAGNRLSRVTEEINDAEADSTTVDYRNTSHNTYDAAGHLIATVVETDFNGDGEINSKTTYDFEYDGNGNPSRRKEVRYVGKANEVTYYWEFQYDADDNISKSSYEVKPTNLGAHSKWSTTFTYDEHGNETVRVTSVESDAEVIPDGVLTITSNYSDQGVIVSQLHEEDIGNDGNVDHSKLITLSYQPLEQGIMYLLSSLQ